MSESPASRTEAPGSHIKELLADLRTWTAFGIILLNFDVLHTVKNNPELLKEAAFIAYITTIAGGSLATLMAFLFGGTKSGGETSAKLASAVAPPPVAGAATSYTASAPASLDSGAVG